MVSKCLSFHLHLQHHLSPFSETPSKQISIHHHFPTPATTRKLTLTHKRCSSFLMASTNSSSPPQFSEFEPDNGLINDDLRPTKPEERTFSGWEMASLWVGLVVGVPTYYLAGSLVDLGMAWWQGIATVVAANIILLVPLVLTGEPGTRYGISFPVLARSAFGIRGANVPTLLRALVGCGWYGIETWIGGEAIFLLLPSYLKETVFAHALPWLGTSPLEFGCFIIFWLAQLAIVMKGIDGIRVLEKYSAPILIVLTSWLLGWAQKDQILGQAGLPIFMGAFTFVGLAVTTSTKVIFGRVISNPIQLLGQIGGLFTVILAIFGISLATITTNIAANIVAPANALVNLSPSIFTFQRGALLTALLGIACQPWRLLQSSESFVYTWLVSYSALLGPIGGIVLVDYYLLQRTKLNISALYTTDPLGVYYYTGGYNLAAMTALVIGILPVIPGFLQKVGILTSVPNAFTVVYNNAWFISFFSAGIVYWILSSLFRTQKSSQFTDPLLPRTP
ncbi:hypothetical protein AQUCO_00901069v1 [Aquilegia coerulea]|uniref:Uncharacterized protein n=1 Tax=Aquilegia coerulea TaxID=218851 RepID=A0A2G5EGK2_AQUCA|nr:hypothetical protein AQUCO_00901069v1 [Aquilegia coerulea]